ncbi:kinase-like domain-containing protein [Xylaria telfairii]|nr:kinase-like domain-containing protein [Xylaria telfairii]
MSTLTADDSEDNPKLSKIIQALHTQGRLSRSATTGFKGGRVTDILLPFPRNGQGLPVALSDQERRRFIECQQSILSKDQDFRNAIARRGAEHFHFPEDWALQTFSQVSNEGDRKLDFDDEAALLGRGGFGRVAAVRMRRHPSEPIRALKRVTRPNSDTWSAIDRIGDGERERFPDGRQEHFEQERKALLHIREKTPRDEWASLRDIKQNHLIEIVTTFTDPQAFYLLMSPVASCNLEDVMHSEHEVHRATLLRRLPQFFGCIAATVFFLHRHNIRHGDLKPKNILIVLDKMPSSPKICICDFATARYAVNGSSVEARGSRRVEDEAYTTPERCKKEPQDLPDDMYTLGLVFLEMITVIKGKSKKDLCEYIENVGGNGTLPILTNRCLPETLHSWLDGLLCSGELESDAAIDLVKKLIRESPEARLDSVGVVRAIRDARGANLDWGPCCQPWYEQTMLSDAGTNDTNVFANILDYTLGEIGNNNRSDEQSRPQCPHRNVDSKSLTITREKSLEWRIVVGIDADWPIIERKINFWIPATGFRLKAHSGSSISIKWPHFNNLCEERDGMFSSGSIYGWI